MSEPDVAECEGGRFTKEGERVVLMSYDKRWWFFVHLKRGTTVKVQRGKYKVDALIGKPYGSVFEARPRSLEFVGYNLGLDPHPDLDGGSGDEDGDGDGDEDGGEDGDLHEVGQSRDEGNVAVGAGAGAGAGGGAGAGAGGGAGAGAGFQMTDKLAIADSMGELPSMHSRQELGETAILSLKHGGASGAEIVAALVQHSKTFGHKTEFSKAKYVKRKALKFVRRLRLLPANARWVLAGAFERQPMKLCGLRPDTFARMMTAANIRAGSEVIVMENSSGIIAGAIADRMGGVGRMYIPHLGFVPSISAYKRYNITYDVDKFIVPLSLVHMVGQQPCPGSEFVNTTELGLGPEALKQSAVDSCLRRDIEYEEEKLRKALLERRQKGRTGHQTSQRRKGQKQAGDSKRPRPDGSESGSQIAEEMGGSDQKRPKVGSDEGAGESAGVSGAGAGAGAGVVESAGDSAADSAGVRVETSAAVGDVADADTLANTDPESVHIPVTPELIKRAEHHAAQRLVRNSGRLEQAADNATMLRCRGADSLIVVMDTRPLSVVLLLLRYLRPSSPFAIFHQYLEPLSECYHQILHYGLGMDLKLSETWTREMQMIPNRTRPMMNMHGGSGFILTGVTRVNPYSALLSPLDID